MSAAHQAENGLFEKIDWLRTCRFGSQKLNFASVFNLSSMQISCVEMEVLCRGSRFGLPPSSICKEEIPSEFELYYNQVDCLLGDSTCPEKRGNLKSKLASLANEYTNIKQDHSAFPLGKEHMEAIRQLRSRKDIVIGRPDKGSGVVLLDEVHYIGKIMAILNDQLKFEC